MGKWCSNSGRVVLKQRADGAWVPIFAIWRTLSTPLCESAHYNDNLGPSLTGVTICHSLLCNRSIIARLALKQKRAAATYAAARGLSALGVSSLP